MQMTTMSQPVLSFFHPTTVHHRYNHLISAVTTATSLPHLKQIHAQILRSHLDHSNSLLLKLIITSLTLSSSLDYALSVFTHLHKPEPHLTNRFLRELSRSNEPEQTLLVFDKMRRDGLPIDRFTFPSLLKASARVSALGEGRVVHGLGVKMGFDSDPFVQTGLVGMYAACGHIQDARLVFDKMSYRDIVTWNIMIDGYVYFR